MKFEIPDALRAPLMIMRWLIVGYSAVVLVGFMLFRLPDWVYAPALGFTSLTKATFSLLLPEGISSAIAILLTIMLPGLIIIWSTSDN